MIITYLLRALLFNSTTILPKIINTLGRNLNVYLSEETYQKLEPLIKERRVSKFIQEAIEERLTKKKEEKNTAETH